MHALIQIHTCSDPFRPDEAAGMHVWMPALASSRSCIVHRLKMSTSWSRTAVLLNWALPSQQQRQTWLYFPKTENVALCTVCYRELKLLCRGEQDCWVMLRFDHVIRGSDKDVYINGNVAFMELPFHITYGWNRVLIPPSEWKRPACNSQPKYCPPLAAPYTTKGMQSALIDLLAFCALYQAVIDEEAHPTCSQAVYQVRSLLDTHFQA
eukprot:scaffold38838_cov18-Tisochrysis_lutea.AAC.4